MSDWQGNRIPEPEDLGPLLEELASFRRTEDGERPRPLQAAERRAARAGKSIDEMLAEDRARLRQSRYPGPECLQPYEVERYFLGALKPERMAHRDTCAACSALLRAAMPSESDAERIVEEVREMAKALGRVPVAEPVAVWWRRWLPKPTPIPRPGFALGFGIALEFLTDALAATLPIVLGLSGVLLFYRFITPHSDPSVVAAVVPAASVVGLAAAVPLAAAAAATLSTLIRAGWGFSGRRFLQASGGALVGNLLLVIVISVGGSYVLSQSIRTLAATLTMAQERLGELVAASFDARQATGVFPLVQARRGHLVVTTAEHTQDKAVYRASTEGLPGALVAEVRPGEGEIYWQRGDKRELRAEFLLGTVDFVGEGRLVLVGPHGKSHTVKTPPGWTVPRRGENLVAVVEPKSQTAASLHVAATLQ